MKNSKIGWTDHTWNPWRGCNKVSDACKFCYIGQIMRRSGNEPFHGPMRTSVQNWKTPNNWNRVAQGKRRRPRVFTCSISDFFHHKADNWRPSAWETIRECQNLDWLVLTKRPELIRDRLPPDWGSGYPNVWLGVTCESQKQIHRVDLLTEIPAAVRFVSAEPLLAPVKFGRRRMSKLDWIITGCERAAKDKRRPMNEDWVRSIQDECDESNVAFFHKQYYIGNQIIEDGRLDGRIRQSWPKSVKRRTTPQLELISAKR